MACIHPAAAHCDLIALVVFFLYQPGIYILMYMCTHTNEHLFCNLHFAWAVFAEKSLQLALRCYNYIFIPRKNQYNLYRTYKHNNNVNQYAHTQYYILHVMKYHQVTMTIQLLSISVTINAIPLFSRNNTQLWRHIYTQSQPCNIHKRVKNHICIVNIDAQCSPIQ